MKQYKTELIKINNGNVTFYAVIETKDQEGVTLLGFKNLTLDSETIGMIDLYELMETLFNYKQEFINSLLEFIDYIIEPNLEFVGTSTLKMATFISNLSNITATPAIALDGGNTILVPLQSHAYWTRLFNVWSCIEEHLHEKRQHHERIKTLFIDFINGLSQFYILSEQELNQTGGLIDQYCTAYWLSNCDLIDIANTVKSPN